MAKGKLRQGKEDNKGKIGEQKSCVAKQGGGEVKLEINLIDEILTKERELKIWKKNKLREKSSKRGESISREKQKLTRCDKKLEGGSAPPLPGYGPGLNRVNIKTLIKKLRIFS